MKQFTLNVLFVLLALLFIPSSAYGFRGHEWKDGFKFLGTVTVGDYKIGRYTNLTTGEHYASVDGYEGDKKDIKIPSKFKYEKDTYIVREISLFLEGRNIKSIWIPSTVWTIAFCRGVEYVNFEKNSELKTIGLQSFLRSNLKTIIIPMNVGLELIDSSAFAGCESLEYVQLPSKLKEISDDAFFNCKSLTRITLPLSLEKLGTGCFGQCDNLKTVNCEKRSKTANAFENRGLLKEIPDGAFGRCNSLTSVEIITPFQVDVNIGEGAFYGCEKLTTVLLGNHMNNVGSHAFYECKSLTVCKQYDSIYDELYISGNVGEFAFYRCKSIKDIMLTGDSIKDGAFQSCNNLEEISFHGTKYIGKSAFYDAYSENAKRDILFIKTEDISFASTLEDIFGNTFAKSNTLKEIGLSYSYFAKLAVKPQIEAWRKKKEYETSAQYRERVSAENQQKKIAQLLDSARTNYIKQHAPQKLNCTIDSYDADGGVYKIKVENINTYKYWSGFYKSYYDKQISDSIFTFCKVPVSDAPAFKENFKDVKIEPTYCIAKNYLGIASCKFTVNGKTYESPTLYDDETANVQFDLPPLEIDLGGGKKNDMAQVQIPIDNALDKNIPSVNVVNKNCFAVIIGNENYSQVAKVSYAENDAKVFAEYCRKTLGMPKENVRTYGNATYAGFVQAMKDIKDIAKAYNGNLSVVFYYAGHGIPNEQSKDAYLLPVDADGKQMDVCYSVGKLYKELGSLGAMNVTVFMDACFSGAQRGEGMLASARGVALKAKAEVPQGNMVVFSAATGDETAYPYKEKGHGMFTYFLLKKLQESKGDCTLQELGEYIQTNVKQQSVVINRKSQTPTVVPSAGIADSWKTMKLK